MFGPKIFVGLAVVILVLILGGILVLGPAPSGSDQFSAPGNPGLPQIMELEIELERIEIVSVTDDSAVVDVSFILTNPNPRSMIVQVLDYQLFENGYSQSAQIAGGQIGARAAGMVEFGNNFFTILGESSITLEDRITIVNSGSTPELWSALENDAASWRATGNVFYNLSSMTSGQENQLAFDLAY